MNLTGMQLISGLQFINGIQNPGFVDVLIVAGGGGGGSGGSYSPFQIGGGGGAGGVITSSLQVGTGTHTVVVGGGGSRGPADGGEGNYNYSGANSYISGPRGITIAYSGGMGAGTDNPGGPIAPGIRGSGGGGNGNWNNPGAGNQPNYAGTPGQGFPGGIHTPSSPAGGGGADQAGTPAGAPGAGLTGGKGGDGRSSWITGANVIYGGGGGGGSLPGFPLFAGGGRGGLGGGGGGAGGARGNFGANISGGGITDGAYYSALGTYENTPLGSYGPGAVNSGGGGGGGSHGDVDGTAYTAPPSVDGGRWLGGAGGSGIVVLRHPVASSIGTVTGGGNVLYVGSTNVVYVFTSSGTITWS